MDIAINPAKSVKLTVDDATGKTPALDITGWSALRWHSRGGAVTRLLDGATVGISTTFLEEPLSAGVTSVVFAGPHGAEIVVEGLSAEPDTQDRFYSDPAKAQTFIIGSSDPIDVSGWGSLRWNSQDGTTRVCRCFNGAAAGRTGLSGEDFLQAPIATVEFTGPAGAIVEVEGCE